MHVLLVDDHSLFREGIKLILADLADDMTFSHADTCEAALGFDPDDIDLVLLDYHLPGTSDREAILRVRDHFAGAVLVVLSGEEDSATIRQSINDGAAGYIPKSSSPEVLIAALQLVLAGGSYLPPHVLDEVPPRAAAEGSTDFERLVDALSERQRDVLAMALQGKLNKVIASELNIAEGTVKAHLSAAFRALGARNRTEAVYIATRHNLQLGDPLSSGS